MSKESSSKGQHSRANLVNSLYRYLAQQPNSLNKSQIHCACQNIDEFGEFHPDIADAVHVLYISNNLFTNLKNISQFSQLTVLSVNNNYIKYIEDVIELSKLHQLKKLSMQGNAITFLPFYREALVELCVALEKLDNIKVLEKDRIEGKISFKKIMLYFTRAVNNEVRNFFFIYLSRKKQYLKEFMLVIARRLRCYPSEQCESYPRDFSPRNFLQILKVAREHRVLEQLLPAEDLLRPNECDSCMDDSYFSKLVQRKLIKLNISKKKQQSTNNVAGYDVVENIQIWQKFFEEMLHSQESIFMKEISRFQDANKEDELIVASDVTVLQQTLQSEIERNFFLKLPQREERLTNKPADALFVTSRLQKKSLITQQRDFSNVVKNVVKSEVNEIHSEEDDDIERREALQERYQTLLSNTTLSEKSILKSKAVTRRTSKHSVRFMDESLTETRKTENKRHSSDLETPRSYQQQSNDAIDSADEIAPRRSTPQPTINFNLNLNRSSTHETLLGNETRADSSSRGHSAEEISHRKPQLSWSLLEREATQFLETLLSKANNEDPLLDFDADLQSFFRAQHFDDDASESIPDSQKSPLQNIDFFSVANDQIESIVDEFRAKYPREELPARAAPLKYSILSSHTVSELKHIIQSLSKQLILLQREECDLLEDSRALRAELLQRITKTNESVAMQSTDFLLRARDSLKKLSCKYKNLPQNVTRVISHQQETIENLHREISAHNSASALSLAAVQHWKASFQAELSQFHYTRQELLQAEDRIGEITGEIPAGQILRVDGRLALRRGVSQRCFLRRKSLLREHLHRWRRAVTTLVVLGVFAEKRRTRLRRSAVRAFFQQLRYLSLRSKSVDFLARKRRWVFSRELFRRWRSRTSRRRSAAIADRTSELSVARRHFQRFRRQIQIMRKSTQRDRHLVTLKRFFMMLRIVRSWQALADRSRKYYSAQSKLVTLQVTLRRIFDDWRQSVTLRSTRLTDSAALVRQRRQRMVCQKVLKRWRFRVQSDFMRAQRHHLRKMFLKFVQSLMRMMMLREQARLRAGQTRPDHLRVHALRRAVRGWFLWSRRRVRRLHLKCRRVFDQLAGRRRRRNWLFFRHRLRARMTRRLSLAYLQETCAHAIRLRSLRDRFSRWKLAMIGRIRQVLEERATNNASSQHTNAIDNVVIKPKENIFVTKRHNVAGHEHDVTVMKEERSVSYLQQCFNGWKMLTRAKIALQRKLQVVVEARSHKLCRRIFFHWLRIATQRWRKFIKQTADERHQLQQLQSQLQLPPRDENSLLRDHDLMKQVLLELIAEDHLRPALADVSSDSIPVCEQRVEDALRTAQEKVRVLRERKLQLEESVGRLDISVRDCSDRIESDSLAIVDLENSIGLLLRERDRLSACVTDCRRRSQTIQSQLSEEISACNRATAEDVRAFYDRSADGLQETNECFVFSEDRPESAGRELEELTAKLTSLQRLCEEEQLNLMRVRDSAASCDRRLEQTIGRRTELLQLFTFWQSAFIESEASYSAENAQYESQLTAVRQNIEELLATIENNRREEKCLREQIEELHQLQTRSKQRKFLTKQLIALPPSHSQGLVNFNQKTIESAARVEHSCKLIATPTAIQPKKADDSEAKTDKSSPMSMNGLVDDSDLNAKINSITARLHSRLFST